MKESWLEKQLQEAEKDPREQAIQKMYKDMVKVTEPIRILPISEVAEFDDYAVTKGVVGNRVNQGHMGATEILPIRTDNASDCNVFLIKTLKENGHIEYVLVHVWAGNLDLNRPGARRKDIAAITNETSLAIGITGGRSASIVPTAREFKYEGITTVKHIHIPSGNRYVSVVYRPEDNNILVRVGADTDATEVYLYEGF